VFVFAAALKYLLCVHPSCINAVKPVISVNMTAASFLTFWDDV
jgi:hypothetical protein